METLQRTANRGSVSTGYDIDYSVKLQDTASEYFQRAASGSDGDRRTMTLSIWLKRTQPGNDHIFYSQGSHVRFRFKTSDYFSLRLANGHEFENENRKFRDPSAWYHMVVAIDTTQSTDTNRVKIYWNGVQETTFNTAQYPDQNEELTLGQFSSVTTQLGWFVESGYGFDGYFAEVQYIDGLQKAPTDFGKFDPASGIWQPIEYTGSYGTEGFYLNFSAAGDMGNDSVNNNDFAVQNINQNDQATDTPTNNFCTWSPLWVYATNRTVFQGATNLEGSSAWGGCKGTIGVTNGKWYWENKASGNDTIIGWQSDGPGDIYSGNAHNVLDTIGLYRDGNYIWIKDSTSGRNDTSASGSNASGQIIGFALDLDSSPQTATFYRNGSAIASDVNIDGLTGKTLFPFISQYNQNTEANFGGYTSFTISSGATDANGYGTFEYAPPSGYYAICTKNLAEFG